MMASHLARTSSLVIPAKAGTHLVSDGRTQVWSRTLPCRQSKALEMGSRLRGNDEDYVVGALALSGAFH